MVACDVFLGQPEHRLTIGYSRLMVNRVGVPL
jgi:hypothetical protein